MKSETKSNNIWLISFHIPSVWQLVASSSQGWRRKRPSGVNSLRYSCCCYHWPRCWHVPFTCSSGIFSYTNQFGTQATPFKFSPTGNNDLDRGSDQGSLAIQGVDLCLPSSSLSCLPIRQL